MFKCVSLKYCSVIFCLFCRLTTSALSVTNMKVCSKLEQIFYCRSVTLLKAHVKTKFHFFMYYLYLPDIYMTIPAMVPSDISFKSGATSATSPVLFYPLLIRSDLMQSILDLLFQ